MGTRNITRVISGGELKVCQYGQWDGYPMGAGMSIANFVRGTSANEMVGRLKHVTLMTVDHDESGLATGAPRFEEFPSIARDTRGAYSSFLVSNEVIRKYGHDLVTRYLIACRDTGCEILDIIFYGNEDLVLWTTDHLVGNDGDWQIEAVWELDYDTGTMTGIWHGKRRSWSFGKVRGWPAEKLRNEMRGFEREA